MHPKKKAVNELKDAGFRLIRSGDHDIWQDPVTKDLIPIRHGSDFDDDDLRMIRKELKAVLKKREGRQ